MRKAPIAIAMACMFVLASAGVRAEEKQPNDLSFLVGSWMGTGGGEPGKGAGSFSFTSELSGRILVRRAHSEYPASDGRPAVTHDDFLIVHSGQSEAIYFDNEGHVINYRVRTDPEARTVTFLSSDPPPAPAFRLTYRRLEGNKVEVTFEIGIGGKGEFKTYVKGTAVRRN